MTLLLCHLTTIDATNLIWWLLSQGWVWNNNWKLCFILLIEMDSHILKFKVWPIIFVKIDPCQEYVWEQTHIGNKFIKETQKGQSSNNLYLSLGVNDHKTFLTLRKPISTITLHLVMGETIQVFTFTYLDHILRDSL